MQKELARKIEAGELGTPRTPHPGAGMNFTVPDSAIQAGAFLEVHPDRVLVGKGAAEAMKDWRLVFVGQPTDFKAPSLHIRPIDPIGNLDLPQEAPLTRVPPKADGARPSPDGVVSIPPETVQGPPQHPYRFPIWIFLTTDNPGQWEETVQALNEEQSRRVDEFLVRAKKENMSEVEIRAELDTSAPFNGLQEIWHKTYRNRYEDK